MKTLTVACILGAAMAVHIEDAEHQLAQTEYQNIDWALINKCVTECTTYGGGGAMNVDTQCYSDCITREETCPPIWDAFMKRWREVCVKTHYQYMNMREYLW